MNHHSILVTAVACFVSFYASHAAEPALPTRKAEVPRNGEIRLKDYGYRNWGPELVRYRIDPKQFRQRNSALLGPDGKAVPFQIHEGVLSFVAELAKGQTVEYKLQASDKDRSREGSNLGLKKSGKFLEITNDRGAVRVPVPQEKTFSKPTLAIEAPAPLAGFKQQGHDWMGGSHFQGERKILSYAFHMIEEGPASMEYEARYRTPSRPILEQPPGGPVAANPGKQFPVNRLSADGYAYVATDRLVATAFGAAAVAAEGVSAEGGLCLSNSVTNDRPTVDRFECFPHFPQTFLSV